MVFYCFFKGARNMVFRGFEIKYFYHKWLSQTFEVLHLMFLINREFYERFGV